MYSLFSSLKSLTKRQSSVIDIAVCRLHYRLTVIILMVFSILVTATQYFGDPIECINPSPNKYTQNLIDTYCWIHSTYSVKKAWMKEVGKEVPYPGIEKALPTDEVVYHKYYLWIPFVLFTQAILFYVPRYIWKNQESGRVKSLILGLDSAIIPQDERDNAINILVNYFRSNIHNNNSYFAANVFCEFLNIINVICQMIYLNKFFGGMFTAYGWDVLTFTDWSNDIRYDPMLRIFPTMTKCKIHLYGSSGDVTKDDLTCLMPINILNEKIYIFLWFWLWFLLIVTIFGLILRVLTIISPLVRLLLTQSSVFPKRRSELDRIIRMGNVGDWYFLDLLSKNIDRCNFDEFISKYSDSLPSLKNA